MRWARQALGQARCAAPIVWGAGGAVLAVLLVTAMSPAAAATDATIARSDYPVCMQIQQPTITGAELSADGALFRWTWATPPDNGSAYSVYRYINGGWADSVTWGELGGVDALFVPWVDNGVRAEALEIAVVVKCYGNIPVNTYVAAYADYEDQVAAEKAAAAAAAEAAQAAAAGASAAAAVEAGNVSSATTTRYTTCAAMRADYPAGVSTSRNAARLAVRDGQLRPAVRPKVYHDSRTSLDGDRDGSMCERKA
jgi:hypothetical protein